MGTWSRAAAMAAMLCGSALAQTQAPISSFDLERLELNPSGFGSMAVGSGALLPASTFRSAVLAHYENDPLAIDPGDGTTRRIIRERLTLHLMRQYSLAQRVEFALVLPIVVFQTGDDLTSVGLPRLATGGLASPALSARFGLLRSVDGSPIDLAIQAGTSLPFGNAYAYARNPGLTFTPRLLASLRLNELLMVSGEVGGLLRPPVTVGDYRIHNELHLNGAVATLQGAVRGELAVRAGHYFGKAPGSLELLGGARYALTERIELTGLVGFGLFRAPGTPMFRVLFGASFLEGTKLQDLAPAPLPPRVDLVRKEDPKPPPPPPPKNDPKVEPKCQAGKPHVPADCPELDLDGDGVLNASDTCHSTAEDKDGFQDDDGCPDLDNDADGLPDKDDRCADHAGAKEQGGCPEADQDGDGIPDSKDKCPAEAGTADREGCAPPPDEDKDGVPDEEDRCPQQHGPPDRKGCPLTDTDGDGILDSADGCPGEKGPLEARGCPVRDTDADGVADHVDNCPTEKGTQKNRGCKEEQRVFITREKIVILDKVYFATDSARLLPRSFPLLKQVAKVIKEHPEIREVIIEGHTDNTGNALKNLKLSRERAESVRKFLILNGVKADRMQAKGYGQSRPVMPNLTNRGREMNRRVEFVIPDGQE